MSHPAQLSEPELLSQCRIERTRRSGPGGQHRNKVETAVVVRHLPSGVQAEASERRSQSQNRRQAIRRLRIQLALEIRTPPTRSPSSTWSARLRAGKLGVSPQHDEFPSVLAEALDVLADCQWSASEAAARLGLTTSQLVKLLAKEPEALRLVNERRRGQGMPVLR